MIACIQELRSAKKMCPKILNLWSESTDRYEKKWTEWKPVVEVIDEEEKFINDASSMLFKVDEVHNWEVQDDQLIVIDSLESE